MGLIRDWLKSKNMKDPVRGTLLVTASTYPPESAAFGHFSINGVVRADGIPPTAIEHEGFAKLRKWPQAGQTLPVTVDRSDPSRVAIAWDEVPDSFDAACQHAEQVAATLRGLGGAAATPGVTASTVTIDASSVPGLREEVMKLAMSGAGPDEIMAALRERGVPIPDGEAFAMPAREAAPAEQDPAARLRRLEKLRRNGLISEDEYGAQRARILGVL